jgi:hypothetical protein
MTHCSYTVITLREGKRNKTQRYADDNNVTSEGFSKKKPSSISCIDLERLIRTGKISSRTMHARSTA